MQNKSLLRVHHKYTVHSTQRSLKKDFHHNVIAWPHSDSDDSSMISRLQVAKCWAKTLNVILQQTKWIIQPIEKENYELIKWQWSWWNVFQLIWAIVEFWLVSWMSIVLLLNDIWPSIKLTWLRNSQCVFFRPYSLFFKTHKIYWIALILDSVFHFPWTTR